MNNGRISVYQRNNGTWEAQCYVGNDLMTGKRKKITRSGKTKSEAHNKVLDAVSQMRTGTYIEPHKITVGQWMTKWLEEYSKPKVKQSTYVNYRIHIEKRVNPTIGHIPLSKLSVDILQRFINDQAENGSLRNTGGRLSAKTIHNLYLMMHSALKQAYRNDLIPKNYIENISKPKIQHVEMRVLTLDEHNRLVQEIDNSDERYKIGVLIALATGIRIGELCGLQWRDIDTYKQSMKICRTLNRLPAINRNDRKTEVVIGTPKSVKSNREIPLPSFLYTKLEDYKKERATEKEIAGSIYNQEGFIICNELGYPVEPRTVQDTFKRIIKSANIEQANFHALRHTFATRAIESGFEIKTLSEILGHADVSTTLNKYAHALPDQKRKMMESMSKLYS